MMMHVVLRALATTSILCGCINNWSTEGENLGGNTGPANSGGIAAGGDVGTGGDAASASNVSGRGGATSAMSGAPGRGGATSAMSGAPGRGGATSAMSGASGSGATASAGGAGGARTSDSSGAGGSNVDSGAGPACGPAPARYTLLTGVDTGLVRDNTTGLTWMREAYSAPNDPEPPRGQEAQSYCTGRQMRLPTKEEAVAIAGAHYASCAFGVWGTWTSTTGAQGARYWYTVDYLGEAYEQLNDNYPNAVLCVQ